MDTQPYTKFYINGRGEFNVSTTSLILLYLAALAISRLPMLRVFRNEAAIMHISIFFSSLIFIQAIINAFQVMRQSFKTEGKPGALAKVARIPAIICGVALLGQSLYAAYFIFKHVLNYKVAMIRFELLEMIQTMEKFIT